MAKIKGMRNDALARAGTENRQLTSLLIAILRHTGPVTLSAAEAEVPWNNATLNSQVDPVSGALTISISDPH